MCGMNTYKVNAKTQKYANVPTAKRVGQMA
jgi:hypothetical protein